MATCWISTTGTASGDGSQSAPFASFAAALAAFGPGQTYRFQAGIYPGRLDIPASASGTAAQPTVLVSDVKYGARLIGSTSHGLVPAVGTQWVVMDGFEVGGAEEEGVRLMGTNCTVRNCYIHHAAGNGLDSHGTQNNRIEANLFEFNGSNPQQHHGIYADGSGHVITRNILRHNACIGVHLYPSASQCEVSQNLIYGHANKAGLLISGGNLGGNRVLSNTLTGNATGIYLQGGAGDLFSGNLVLGAQPWTVVSSTGTLLDHNMTSAADPFMGTGGQSGDPGFLDPPHFCYWLNTGSKAAGTGPAAGAGAVDFWNRPVAAGTALPIGCFAYDALLVSAAARSTWYAGYPYRNQVAPGQDLPDLWSPPT